MKGEFIVNQEGERLDVLFNANQPALSRSHIKNLINEGKILLNGKKVKAGEKVKLGQKVTFEFEQPKPLEAEAEKIDFEIVYENSTSIPKGSEVIKQTGKYGYKCSTYRVLSQNGKVISKTLISTDTYKPQKQIVVMAK